MVFCREKGPQAVDLDRHGPHGSRLVVAMHIGSCGLKGAKGLWQNLPESYREQALFYTDFWDAYRAILPRERHRAVGKGTGQTNHVERLNLTLRQRVSRLGRKDPFVFKESRKSYRSDLELHSPLQPIDSSALELKGCLVYV